MNKVYNPLEHSSISLHTHSPEDCDKDICVFHKRTEHHLRKFRQRWNMSLGIMERMCSHNVAHPDPDDERVISGDYKDKHACDACCIRFAEQWEVDLNDLH
jgi:hypothetical protein